VDSKIRMLFYPADNRVKVRQSQRGEIAFEKIGDLKKHAESQVPCMQPLHGREGEGRE